MTFRHLKFQDSVVMRSLEKVAREKGLIKEEDLFKTASVKKVSLIPTTNLLSNLLTLSEGLREAGFDKYADELEKNALVYKQAQTLYETFKETGDDLIDAAHPDGGHKLDVNNDKAVFHTILEKHLKNIEVVNKKPTGKLVSSHDILKAVKVVLANGDTSTGLSKPVIDNINNFFITMRNIWQRTRLLGVNSEGALSYNRLRDQIYKYINSKNINNTTIASINSMIDETIKGVTTRQFWGNWGIISNDVDELVFQLKSLKNYINDTVIDDHKALMTAVPQGSDNVFLGKVDIMIQKLNSYRSLLLDEGFTVQDRIEGNKEIDGFIKTLKNWKVIFGKLDLETKASEVSRYDVKLSQMAQQVEQLHREIIGQS